MAIVTGNMNSCFTMPPISAIQFGDLHQHPCNFEITISANYMERCFSPYIFWIFFSAKNTLEHCGLVILCCDMEIGVTNLQQFWNIDNPNPGKIFVIDILFRSTILCRMFVYLPTSLEEMSMSWLLLNGLLVKIKVSTYNILYRL